jgi:hypothetical protein
MHRSLAKTVIKTSIKLFKTLTYLTKKRHTTYLFFLHIKDNQIYQSDNVYKTLHLFHEHRTQNTFLTKCNITTNKDF